MTQTVEQPALKEKEIKTFTPEDIDRAIETLQALKTGNLAIRKKDEFQIGRESLQLSKHIQSEYVQGFQREELISILTAFPKFGHAVKEKIVVMADAQGGILNVIKSMNRPRFDTRWIALMVIGVVLIGAVTWKPELLQSAGAYFDDRYNQAFALAALLIVGVIAYFLNRRRRNKNYYA